MYMKSYRTDEKGNPEELYQLTNVYKPYGIFAFENAGFYIRIEYGAKDPEIGIKKEILSIRMKDKAWANKAVGAVERAILDKDRVCDLTKFQA